MNQFTAISDADDGNAFVGSYGCVASERIGRGLNPLGRGDGNAFVSGAQNYGRIAPTLPQSNAAPGGWGNCLLGNAACIAGVLITIAAILLTIANMCDYTVTDVKVLSGGNLLTPAQLLVMRVAHIAVTKNYARIVLANLNISICVSEVLAVGADGKSCAVAVG